MKMNVVVTTAAIVCASALGLARARADGSTTPTSPPQPAATQTTDIHSLEQRVDNALDQLSEHAHAKGASREDFDRVSAAIQARAEASAATDPGAAQVQERLQRAVSETQARFESGKLAAVDVDRLRGEVIDERLDRSMKRLDQLAKDSKLTPDQFADESKLLEQRAANAKSFDPAAAESNARMEAALDQLHERAKNTTLSQGDVAAFRGIVLDNRLDNALTRLHQRAQDGELTPAEVERAKGVLEQRTLLAKSDVETVAMHERLHNALDALQEKAKTGKVDPNDVAKLHEQLVHHARVAVNGGQRGHTTTPRAPAHGHR